MCSYGNYWTQRSQIEINWSKQFICVIRWMTQFGVVIARYLKWLALTLAAAAGLILLIWGACAAVAGVFTELGRDFKRMMKGG